MRGTPEQSGQYHEDYGREVEYYELEEKKLVNEVAWYIDGMALYNITEPEKYKKQTFGKVIQLLEKLL